MGNACASSITPPVTPQVQWLTVVTAGLDPSSHHRRHCAPTPSQAARLWCAQCTLHASAFYRVVSNVCEMPTLVSPSSLTTVGPRGQVYGMIYPTSRGPFWTLVGTVASPLEWRLACGRMPRLSPSSLTATTLLSFKKTSRASPTCTLKRSELSNPAGKVSYSTALPLLWPLSTSPAWHS